MNKVEQPNFSLPTFHYPTQTPKTEKIDTVKGERQSKSIARSLLLSLQHDFRVWRSILWPHMLSCLWMSSRKHRSYFFPICPKGLQYIEELSNTDRIVCKANEAIFRQYV